MKKKSPTKITKVLVTPKKTKASNVRTAMQMRMAIYKAKHNIRQK